MSDSGTEAAEASPAPHRILIILLGAIGDVIRALPLLGRLRRAYPEAHIAWAVEPLSEPLLRGHPWLDEIIVYRRDRAPWSFPNYLLRIRRGHFDLVLDLQRHLKSGVTSVVSGASRRLGFAASNTKELNHWFSSEQIAPQLNLKLKLLQYQAFAEALRLAPAPIEFGLYPDEARRAQAAKLLGEHGGPLLGVILGSSWPSRIYFAEDAAEVAGQLGRRRGMVPVLIGGPGERGLAGQVASLLAARNPGGPPVVDLAGRTGLADLPGIFQSCAAAFGPDCGPMHIAAAVGCPVVSLWGATAPERSAPWGFADLAIKADIPCHPCYLRRCPIERECMRRIKPAEVVAAVERALGCERRQVG